MAETSTIRQNQNDSMTHDIKVSGRSGITLTGILDIVSFDEHEVILKTSMGLLSVDGDELHILKMYAVPGEVTLEGRLRGLFYIEESPVKQGIFGRKKER